MYIYALESFTHVENNRRCATLMPVDAANTATNYVPVWQTWTLLRQRPTPPASTNSSSTTDPMMLVARTQDLRERMQISRIQNRLTVHELAKRVQCDVETLASFERGDGLISDEVQKRIVGELRIG
tara:strand:- start:6676 stop:7053 length:378 start_codon:yes stop_codon:yes gene_type:complete